MTEVKTYFVSADQLSEREASSGWYVVVTTEHGPEIVRGPISAEHIDKLVHGPFGTERHAKEFGDELARTLNADLE